MAAILPPLRDRLHPPVRVLLVGINPGVRSSQLGHHFAGPSNRFWKLLYESRLVSEPIGFVDDHRLHEWGFGITNLIPRPTPGIDTLRPEEYLAGAKTLRKKIRRVKPEVVAFIGVTLFRSVFGRRTGQPVALGEQSSGSKARASSCCRTPVDATRTFQYGEMLEAFVELRRALERR